MSKKILLVLILVLCFTQVQAQVPTLIDSVESSYIIIETELKTDAIAQKFDDMRNLIQVTATELVRPTEGEFAKLKANNDLVETTVTYSKPAGLVMSYVYTKETTEYWDGLMEQKITYNGWEYKTIYGEYGENLALKLNEIGPFKTFKVNPDYVSGKSEEKVIEETIHFQFPIQTVIKKIPEKE